MNTLLSGKASYLSEKFDFLTIMPADVAHNWIFTSLNVKYTTILVTISSLIHLIIKIISTAKRKTGVAPVH